MGSGQAEKTSSSKVVDYMGEAGLAGPETKDSKPLAVKYYGDCEGGRNSQSHRRVPWKVGLEWSKHGIVPSLMFSQRQHHKAAKRVAPPW